MPITLGQLGGLITPGTPVGAGGRAPGGGQALGRMREDQRQNRWNEQFQQRQFDDRTARADAEEQRALVAGINEHLDAARNGDPSQRSFHKAQAQAFAYELQQKHGISYTLDPEDAAESPATQEDPVAPPTAASEDPAPAAMEPQARSSGTDLGELTDAYKPYEDVLGAAPLEGSSRGKLSPDLQSASDELDALTADALKTLDGSPGEGSRAAAPGGLLGGALRGLPGLDAPTPFASEPYEGTRTGAAGADSEAWTALAPTAALANITAGATPKTPAPSGGAAMPPGGAGELPAPPKRRGYRLTDRDGNVIAQGDLSPDPETQWRAGGAIGALGGPEQDPRKKAILEAATAMADKLSAWMSPEDAYKESMRWAEGAMGDIGKTERATLAGGGPGKGYTAGGGGVGGIPGGSVGTDVASKIATDPRARAAYEKLTTEVYRWWQGDERAKQLAQIHKGGIALGSALNNVRNAQTPQEVGQFLAQVIRAVNTGVATEGDVNRIVNRSLLSRIEAGAAYLMGGGQYSEAEIQGLVRAAENVRSSYSAYLEDQAVAVAQTAGQLLMPMALAVHPSMRNMPSEAIYGLIMGRGMPNVMGGEVWAPASRRGQAAAAEGPQPAGPKPAVSRRAQGAGAGASTRSIIEDTSY